jgi:hypothetical protein
MVSTLVLRVSIVLRYLTVGLVLLLIKVAGNHLARMFLALSLSPVISTQLSRFSIIQLRVRAKIIFYVWASVFPVWRRCSLLESS